MILCVASCAVQKLNKKTKIKMKNLMFMLAAVATAAAVQAASVSWNSGVVFGPSDANGTLVANSAYKLADSSTAAMYVFLIENATAYAKVQSDGVYTTYGSKLGDADATTSTLSSSKFSTVQTSGHAASETVDAAILFTYNDGSKDWWLENTAAQSGAKCRCGVAVATARRC